MCWGPATPPTPPPLATLPPQAGFVFWLSEESATSCKKQDFFFDFFQATGGTIKLAFASGRIANLPGLLQIGGELEVEMGSMSISFNWQ